MKKIAKIKFKITLSFCVCFFSLYFAFFTDSTESSELDFFSHETYMERNKPPEPPRNLRIVGLGDREIDKLLALIKKNDPGVIEENGGRVKIADLFILTKHSNREIRHQASQLIYGISKKVALSDSLPDKNFPKHLGNALNNNDIIIRRDMSAALLNLGHDSFPAVSDLLNTLTDPDNFVRMNSVGAIGKMGSDASFAGPYIIKALSDNFHMVRAFSAGALGKIKPDERITIPALINALEDKNARVRLFASWSLGNFTKETNKSIPALATHLNDTNKQVRQQCANSLVQICSRLQDIDDISAIDNVETAKKSLKAKKDLYNTQLLAVNRSYKYLSLKADAYAKTGSLTPKIRFYDPIPNEIFKSGFIMVNGEEIEIKNVSNEDNSLNYLGINSLFKNGYNYLETKKKEFHFWFEENKLKRFKVPYNQSYAIIVAIDEYEKVKGLSKQDGNKYLNLGFMVEHAKKLSKELLSLGFKETNIFELYNEKATKKNIETLLYEFWFGGKYSDADRLFVYFGGHGDRLNDVGILITYDFTNFMPTVSGLLMNDLTGRHFENITAHHVLVAIDACSSGLALPKYQSLDYDEERLKAFRSLTIINGDTEEKARNVLVAGTKDQKALWINGGLFTQSLIEALKGDADYNKDGIIQFAELSLYVKNRVRAEARATRVRQVPSEFQANIYGDGNFLFFRR